MMGTATTLKMSKSLEQQFSKEFQKSFFQDLDRRFLLILFLSLFAEALIVFVLAQRPIPEYSEREIARIQERFASFILREPVRREQDVASASSRGGVVPAGEEENSEGAGEGDASAGAETEGEGTGPGEGGTGEIRRATAVAAAEARRRSREAISREVSNRGLLGLLTGTGTAAQGKAVSSLFSKSLSGEGVGQDLDKVLDSVDGLKTQGGSGIGSGGGEAERSVRGERSGKKATIDDLVSDLGGVSSQSVSRKGELKVESPEEFVGRGRKSIHRSFDAITEVMLSHIPAIRYCYERELKRSPNLKGKITVRIMVAPDGSVKNVEAVRSSLNNERVERCILARIRLWKDFEPIDSSEGDVTFRQVFSFGY